MGFTTEDMPAAPTARALAEPSQFDLPVREFVGYDPNGTQNMDGSAKVQKEVPRETPAAVEAPAEEVTLSPKVSALARKEQAQRAREKAIAEKERTFAEKMADADKYHQLKTKLAAKDYSAAEELGLTYEEYVKHELNKEASKDPAQERVRQLEEKLTALEKAREEDAVKEYQANQALWKNEIAKTVAENEEFSTIKDLGAEDIVLKHINDSFEEDGLELSVEEAAKEIEEALLERANKFASVTKLKNKVGGKVLGPPKTMTTITQNMTTTPRSVPSSKPFHLMSESEQIQEAIRRVQAAKLQR
jgi:hypothetical protein